MKRHVSRSKEQEIQENATKKRPRTRLQTGKLEAVDYSGAQPSRGSFRGRSAWAKQNMTFPATEKVPRSAYYAKMGKHRRLQAAEEYGTRRYSLDPQTRNHVLADAAIRNFVSNIIETAQKNQRPYTSAENKYIKAWCHAVAGKKQGDVAFAQIKTVVEDSLHVRNKTSIAQVGNRARQTLTSAKQNVRLGVDSINQILLDCLDPRTDQSGQMTPKSAAIVKASHALITKLKLPVKLKAYLQPAIQKQTGDIVSSDQFLGHHIGRQSLGSLNEYNAKRVKALGSALSSQRQTTALELMQESRQTSGAPPSLGMKKL